jgi:acyl transferase domain-containing protein/surfactin synthase thioesterase subunit/acyl carrier protein
VEFGVGAGSIDQYWDNLINGVESISFFSDEELFAAGIDPALLSRDDYVKAAPTVPDFNKFDAAFFGYSPREAILMDPQHRLFLEVVWETMEHAGYCPDNTEGIIGLYCGAGSNITSYANAFAGHPELQGQTAGLEHISNDKDFLGTRVSFKLNLRGPSVTVQTACSTSLVAVHLACQSILNGECDAAIAGASVIRVPHVSGYLAEHGSVHSADGHCRSFDAAGTGTIFGSGVVAVLLKPLEDAMQDGDTVYGVIKGSCINNDGSDKVSYTAPSVTGQARAMVEAMALADVHPDTLDYVECHATGTTVGDPLEIQALSRAFRLHTDRKGYCKVGSVKRNIGHPEQAAGLAALVKTALALKNRVIPGTPVDNLNPNIPFANSPFSVAGENTEWPESNSPRRAGVNSLGIGGTNAFVVLEEAPARKESPPASDGLQLFCLSGNDSRGLRSRVEQFLQVLDDPQAPAFSDLCYTANVSRSALPMRLALVAEDSVDLSKQLRGVLGRDFEARKPPAEKLPIVFMYSGQGAQFPGMGRQLYDEKKAFRDAFDECDGYIQESLGHSIRDIAFGAGAKEEVIHETLHAQPALFAFEYAMTRLWQSVGIEPAAVIGHSLGELVAACIAGVLSLADAVELVCHRARLMQNASSGGAMASAMADESTVRSLLEQQDLPVVIASVNSPISTVISGATADIDTTIDRLANEGIQSQKLRVSHAFHSHMMDPILDEFEAAIAHLPVREPTMPLVSNVTGNTEVTTMDGAYWRSHIRQPVRFADGIRALLDSGHGLFIEVGPGHSLLSMAQQNVTGTNQRWLASLERDGKEITGFLKALAEVYTHGYEPDWMAVSGNGSATRVALPTYPFDRQEFWLKPEVIVASPITTDPVLNQPVNTSGNSLEFVFEYGLVSQKSLADHRIMGHPVLPIASAIELIRRAGRIRYSVEIQRIEDLIYHEAIVLPETEDIKLRLTITTESDSSAGFELMSQVGESGDNWHRKLSGRLMTRPGSPGAAPSTGAGTESGAYDQSLEGPELYETLDRFGLEYGPGFRLVSNLFSNEGQGMAELNPGKSAGASETTILDAAIHSYPLIVDAKGKDLLLPVRIGSINNHGSLSTASRVRITVVNDDTQESELDVSIFDERGALVASLESLIVRAVAPEVLEQVSSQVFASWLYTAEWEELEVTDTAGEGASKWYLSGSDDGSLEMLKDLLLSRGQDCSFDPAGRDDEIDHVVYMADLSPLDKEPSLEEINDRYRDALRPLHELVQQFSSEGRFPDLWIVSRGAQQLFSEAVNPSAAGLWGFAQTANLEFPHLLANCVDLDLDAPVDVALQGLADQLVSSSDRGVQLALRNQKIYRRKFCRLETPSSESGFSTRPDSTYLITGGLGSLGLQMSRWLVKRHGVRSLVLTSRFAAAKQEKEPAIEELRILGCKLSIVEADISKERDVKRLFKKIDGLPPLRGVIHAAGVLADGIISNLSWDDYQHSADPKVSGAWLLHQYTKDLDLDFFVMESSILSLIGSPGQANYTASNAFLDSFAAFRRNLGLKASVQNWGPWRESGMVTESSVQGDRAWKSRGFKYIDPLEGIRVFAHLLSHDLDMAAVAQIDWPVFIGSSNSSSGFYDEFGSQMAATGQPLAAGELQTLMSAAAPKERVELILKAMRFESSKTLGFEDLIDPDQPLNELGLDSLMSVTLSNRLGEQLGVDVPVREMIQGKSLNELARYIDAQISGGSDYSPSQPESTPTDRWLIFPKPNPDAKVRLLCFNYAGGGATTYRPWADLLDDRVELVAIEPPGRGSRFQEPHIMDLQTYKREITTALQDYLDKPYALFGHCLGGLVLHEVARNLADMPGAEMTHIFVSGSRPPHQVSRPGKFEESLLATLVEHPDYLPRQPLHEQIDEVFAMAIRHFDIGASEEFLSHPDLKAILMPAIRADFSIAASYTPMITTPLDVAVTCFHGVDDHYVTKMQALEWNKYTNREFRILYRAFAHYMVVEDREFIVETINKSLSS